MRLKKYKSQGKAVEVTVNSKEDFVQEFGFRVPPALLLTPPPPHKIFDTYFRPIVRTTE